MYVVYMYRHEDMVARQENQHQLYLLSSSQTYQSNSCAGVCCIHPFAVLELHHSGGPKLGISYQNSQILLKSKSIYFQQSVDPTCNQLINQVVQDAVV